MFKLTRLWDLVLSVDHYSPREIPPEKRDFNARFTEDIKVVALFEPSVKYQLIDEQGLDCYTETEEGLLCEIGFAHRGYLISWLLGLGNKVKVLEPEDIANEIQSIAKSVFERYK